MKAVRLSLGATLVLALHTPVYAAPPSMEPEDAEKIISAVDADLSAVKGDISSLGLSYGQPVLKTAAGRIQKRLRDGQMHFALNDHLRAAIVLFDVVDHPEARSYPGFDDALFYLAESLRHLKNRSDARKYYEELLPRVSGERLKSVVLGLLEIAAATRRYDDAERYIAVLRNAAGVGRAEADYTYGKALVLSKDPARMNSAYEALASVGEQSPVAAQAAYYAGVVRVQQGRYADALPHFSAARERAATGDALKKVRELATLSIGRVHFELGNLDQAIQAYLELSRSSPHFSDMLFEVAWAHVKAAKLAQGPEAKKAAMAKALHMAELLMASAPDSRLYPDGRILEGNLQIQLGAPEEAYETFQRIVDSYGGARTHLAELIARNPDPRQFFDQLISADMHNVSAEEVLPHVAVSWAAQTPEMERASQMLGDLKSSGDDERESVEILNALTIAINGEGRYEMFSALPAARMRAAGVRNRLLLAQRRLLDVEARIVGGLVEDVARQDAMVARRRELETQLDLMGIRAADDESSSRPVANAYRDVELKVYQQTYAVSSMKAELTAIDAWLGENRSGLTHDQLTLLGARLREARAVVTAIDEDLKALLSDAHTQVLVARGDGGREHLRAGEAAYEAMAAEELTALRAARGRVGSAYASVFARLDSMRGTIDGLKNQMAALDGTLDGQIAAQVAEVREQIDQERARFLANQGEAKTLRSDTETMLGPVATRTIQNVADEFKDLVTKADVGIIDVAWARKQGVTTRVADLAKAQQERTRELEVEFADVLESN